VSVRTWPKHPLIYEINTWVWLQELSRHSQREITLTEVPAQVWDALADYGFDAVWLMGVWERSPASRKIAREHPDLIAEYRRALPDWTPADVVGSPYSVRRYVVDDRLGGPTGLAAARAALAERGIRLLLDFVPNHVALDHPWVLEHPEYLMQHGADLGEEVPGDCFEAGGRLFAHGRDPYFPPWTDTAQVNAFHSGLREAFVDTLRHIGGQCDGVRCDMAMLVVNRIFERTWGARAGNAPLAEMWPDLIGAVRRHHPEFLFIAEAYWDMEWELQQLGFDYCYDKRLYDRLTHGDAASIHVHLTADLKTQQRLLRFVENHDEPRAAAAFAPRKARAAAVIAMTLPGAGLLHQGQLEGFRARLPVQLGRGCPETIDRTMRGFLGALLGEIAAPVFREGAWQLCERSGWPDNPSWQQLLVWCWRLADERRLIVVNLSGHAAQGLTRLPWEDLQGSTWRLHDCLSGDVYERRGDEMLDPGLYVGLPPWGVHFLRFERQ
jgi:hypothetical protein